MFSNKDSVFMERMHVKDDNIVGEPIRVGSTNHREFISVNLN